ncbi:putative toxin-antitoxin system toxin component, PIN family [Duganella sp. FT109W]|uniref:Toxin-antitoxin system toxin component, PIN family n=1 Tax=Duganella margarita TaxID=2692170 RepID=A0ABW9WCN5_9BURK|nr:putative toxin-antitoxin system toxin component, PIN family [Duganella margarita]
MRLVIDTNVIVSALIARGVPYELLQAARGNRFEIYTSIELLDELEAVLRRKKIASRLTIMQRRPDELRQKFEQVSCRITVPRPYPQIARDPKDDIVLACALAAQASAIVTGDKDLIILNRYYNIPILRPRQALQKIQFRSGVP